jgi:hypothetical protein
LLWASDGHVAYQEQGAGGRENCSPYAKKQNELRKSQNLTMPFMGTSPMTKDLLLGLPS